MSEMDIKKQIFDALSEIEHKIADLKGSETLSRNQTNMEVEILRRQVEKLTSSQHDAGRKVAGALDILRKLS